MFGLHPLDVDTHRRQQVALAICQGLTQPFELLRDAADVARGTGKRGFGVSGSLPEGINEIRLLIEQTVIQCRPGVPGSGHALKRGPGITAISQGEQSIVHLGQGRRQIAQRVCPFLPMMAHAVIEKALDVGAQIIVLSQAIECKLGSDPAQGAQAIGQHLVVAHETTRQITSRRLALDQMAQPEQQRACQREAVTGSQ